MTVEPLEATEGLDRFATSDEIRAALSTMPGFFECDKEAVWEVESDLGGTVQFEADKDEILVLLEKLDTTAN